MDKANKISMKRLLIVIIFFVGLQSVFFGQDLSITDKLTGKAINVLKADNGDSHFSAIEVAEKLQGEIEKNESGKTVQLKLNAHTIQFSAYSPFVIIDNSVFQMPTETKYRFGTLSIPRYFFTLLDHIDDFTEFDPKVNELVIQQEKPNLLSLTTEQRDDSLYVHLETNRRFSRKDIQFKKDGQWLYLTIKNGILDPKINKQKIESDALFETAATQLDEKQARVSLQLASNTEFNRYIVNTEDSNISLLFTLNRTVNIPSFLSSLNEEREKWRIDTIVLDPGHGGRDPGAVGPGSLYEKNITLSMAKSIKSELESRLNINVVLTRDENTFVPIKRRTEIANKAGGKLFISIHVDANPVTWLRGHTVYFLGPAKTEDARKVAQFENSVIKFEETQNHYDDLSNASFILAANAQNSYNKESQNFAAIVDKEITKTCQSKSIGVRQAGFYVLYGTSMPNILIETGFMTNSYDRRKLKSKTYHEKLAEAVCESVIKFKEIYESMTL